MRTKPAIVRTRKELEGQVTAWKQASECVGLIPTMGALHHGHLSLVTAIDKEVDRTIVSIFVNPTQFGPNEDLKSYPRDEQADLSALQTTPVDLVYIPSVEEMYPEGLKTTVHVKGVTDDLEGAARPGHFDGMATVVKALFDHSKADVAIFGEKDYQQLLTIKQFVRELSIPITILGAPLIREVDGLAASSRNRYLSAEDREIAGSLNQVLSDLVKAIEDGRPIVQSENLAERILLSNGFTSVDYITVRDAETLERIEGISRPARALAVARIGSVRLLDNMPITVK